ncbi:MAG: hypothetical protein ACODAJ_05440 [Planctomycetota bacterium]
MSMAEPAQVGVPDQLRECPDCGYQNGFHLALKRLEPSSGEHTLAVQLICPSCSSLFDIGLRMTLSDDR